MSNAAEKNSQSIVNWPKLHNCPKLFSLLFLFLKLLYKKMQFIIRATKKLLLRSRLSMNYSFQYTKDVLCELLPFLLANRRTRRVT